MLCHPNRFGKITVCPRLEIGNSSVIPCRTPSTIAWKFVIRWVFAATSMSLEQATLSRDGDVCRHEPPSEVFLPRVCSADLRHNGLRPSFVVAAHLIVTAAFMLAGDGIRTDL